MGSSRATDRLFSLKISPESGDQLLNEAYAGKGYELKKWAERFQVEEKLLALVIRESSVTTPNRDQLENIVITAYLSLQKQKLIKVALRDLVQS